MPIVRIRWLLQLLGTGIEQLLDQLWILQCRERLLRPIDDKDRPITPEDQHLLTGREFADVDVDRTAGGDRRRVGIHLGDQRYEECDRSDGAKIRGRDVEKITTIWIGDGSACRRISSIHQRLVSCRPKSLNHGLKGVSVERVTGTWSGPYTDPTNGVTTPGNGRKFDHPGAMVLTYRPDHKISKVDIYWDHLMVARQLGIVPK
jgi:hypothetical protein